MTFKNQSLKEKIIVEKIIKKDEKALFQLYKEYQVKIFSFINKRLKNPYLAEELTQDVFIDFIEALRDFNFQSSLKTYLFSIAKNKTIDVIRKKKIKKILFSSLPDNLVENIGSVMFDDSLEKKELSEKIKKSFELLPNDYRTVLRLKYIEGQKVIGIAQRLALGFKATESLIFRARKEFVKVFNSK